MTRINNSNTTGHLPDRSRTGPMRAKNSPPRIDVIRREDKEARVTEFVLESLQAEGAKTPTAYTLIARSVLSPSFRALRALHASGQLQRRVSVILACLEGIEDGQLASATAFVSGLRIAKNPRLLDAHEQLVLGASASWIGDCMRREPEKRDAWECYAPDCSETARRAAVSFERLWNVCEDVPARLPTPVVCLDPFIPAAADGEGQVVVATSSN